MLERSNAEDLDRLPAFGIIFRRFDDNAAGNGKGSGDNAA